METLRFIVKGQRMKKDQASPFNRMVAGSSNFYVAEFVFDSAWKEYVCAACFTVGEEVNAVLIRNGMAIIPDEVLKYKTFGVSVLGEKGNSRLITNEVKVRQIGGK